MKHLTETAKNVVGLLRRVGFNGVRVDARMESSVEKWEWEDEHPNGPPFEDHQRDYAIFIAESEIYDLSPVGLGENQYLEVEVNEGKFRSDFLDYIRTQFGDDVTINVHCRHTEFEIIRNDKKPKATENGGGK